MTPRAILLAAMVLSSGLAVQAQEPIVRPSAEFNGASIKLNKEWRRVGFDVTGNGNVSLEGFTVQMLIRDAYDLNRASNA